MADRQSNERQSRGRQRIPIELITNQDDLYATFSKRRLGLYKKASELCTLCGVDIGIIVFSPTGNPFSFFHPSIESVIERHRNPNSELGHFSRLVDAHTRARVESLNKQLDEILDQRDELKVRETQLNEAEKTREKGWWEVPIELLTKEQVKEWRAWFENLNARVTSRIEELHNGGSVSMALQLQNAPLDQGANASNFGHYPFVSGEVDPSMFYLPQLPSFGGQFGEASTSHLDPFQPQFGHNPFGNIGGVEQGGWDPIFIPYPPINDRDFAGGSGSGQADPSHSFVHDPNGEPGPSCRHDPNGEPGPSRRDDDMDT